MARRGEVSRAPLRTSSRSMRPISGPPTEDEREVSMRFLRNSLVALSLIALATCPAFAADAATTHDGHVMQSLEDAKWGPAPPFVPAGAQMVVLAGNPMAAEPYTVYLKFPAGYAVPAHWHPTDENVTV